MLEQNTSLVAYRPSFVICSYLVHLTVLRYVTDVDFATPLQLTSPGASSAQQFVPDEGSVSMIESMGFMRRQAVAALKATVRTWFLIICLSLLLQ